MKLFKKALSVLALLFVVFAMTGCTQILGKLLNKGAEELEEQKNNTPDPESPSITSEDEGYSFMVHYGAPYTLTIKAEVSDSGVLTYQWYSSSSDKRENATAIEGAAAKLPAYITTAPTAPAKDGEVTYYWCKVTNTSLKTGKTKDNWSERYAITVSNIIRMNGKYIDENTTWNPLYTYYAEGWICIKKALVIPAGTVIKCKKGVYIETADEGTITVTGLADNPVYFTSYLDDSAGIKIPEFIGSATKAAKGDWDGLYIDGAKGSTITNAVFRYANKAAVTLKAETGVNNCKFVSNKSENYRGALDIAESANDSIVTNNIFYDNDWPLSCSSNYSVATSNVFHNPDDDKITNKYQAITMYGGKYIEQKDVVNWKVSELAYLFTDSWLDVKGTLNIGAGVVVKFNKDCYIEVSDTGSITLGTGCILTSWKDDAHGGDIEANGQPVEPKSGDWAGIWLEDKGGYNNSINKDSRVLYNDKSKYEE